MTPVPNTAIVGSGKGSAKGPTLMRRLCAADTLVEPGEALDDAILYDSECVGERFSSGSSGMEGGSDLDGTLRLEESCSIPDMLILLFANPSTMIVPTYSCTCMIGGKYEIGKSDISLSHPVFDACIY